MKNLITEIYSELTDEELKEAILEIKENEPLALIKTDGWVRKLNKKIMEITGENTYSVHLTSVIHSLLKEAAYRFIKKN
jgi:hypothetical protein